MQNILEAGSQDLDSGRDSQDRRGYLPTASQTNSTIEAEDITEWTHLYYIIIPFRKNL